MTPEQIADTHYNSVCEGERIYDAILAAVNQAIEISHKAWMRRYHQLWVAAKMVDDNRIQYNSPEKTRFLVDGNVMLDLHQKLQMDKEFEHEHNSSN